MTETLKVDSGCFRPVPLIKSASGKDKPPTVNEVCRQLKINPPFTEKDDIPYSVDNLPRISYQFDQAVKNGWLDANQAAVFKNYLAAFIADEFLKDKYGQAAYIGEFSICRGLPFNMFRVYTDNDFTILVSTAYWLLGFTTSAYKDMPSPLHDIYRYWDPVNNIENDNDWDTQEARTTWRFQQTYGVTVGENTVPGTFDERPATMLIAVLKGLQPVLTPVNKSYPCQF